MRLAWCVGRFVYPRGSTAPLHFMELKEFAVDDGADFAQLLTVRSMRGMRSRNLDARDVEDEFDRWSQGREPRFVAEMTAALLEATNGSTVVELYPGSGVAFECLKFLLERSGAERRVRYVGFGEQSFRLKFEILHGDDEHESAFIEESPAALNTAVSSAEVVVVNWSEAIRHREPPRLTFDELLGAVDRPACAAVRVTEAAVDEERLTVKGCSVNLPARARFMSLLAAAPAHWFYRYVPRYDATFFLPGEADTGLLLTYSAPGIGALEGFEPVGG